MVTGVKSNGNYAVLNHVQDTYCFFLFCGLLYENAMFLHTQKRSSEGAGPTRQLVHCPVRVGGKGFFDCAFGRVSISPFFQYPKVVQMPKPHTDGDADPE
jgi:hypothetical protein